MSPIASTAKAAADKARQAVAKVRPGAPDGQRSLPIRAEADVIRARWDDPAARAAVLEGLSVKEASLEVGDQDRDWGRTTTLRLELDAAVPGMATQALTGKAVRRLKALVETGEIPTTDFNPSAREDAGEEAKA
ncbi:MAG TPA: hypothetical protein VIL49_11565 [Capillimicrobium sp.]|jgi:hypothetical protein